METQWITWALQALIIFVLVWFRQQLDKNTSSITNLSVELPKTYMPRLESEAARKELRDASHELRDDIGVISNRVAVLEGANDLAERLAVALRK